jgi:hypothetical protein
MAGLSGIWAIPALSKESDESQRAPKSQVDRDIKLMDWFAHQYEQGLDVTAADKKVYLELQSRYGASRQETTDSSPRGRHTLDEYIWTTAPYEWVDISTIGTNTGISVDDQNLGPFTLGFAFPFYGTTYTSIRVCSNGWLSFTSTSTFYNNTAIPATAEPNNVLYPFWDDMYWPGTGQVLYYADAANQRFIVSWLAVPHISGTEPYTYQAILYPNGNIIYQYQTIPTATPGNTSCTVGVENATGTQGVQVCFDGTGTPPTSGTALLVGQPDGVPNPVTDLTAQYIAPNVVLTWTDPTQDTNGNPLTPTNVEVWLGQAGTGTLLATVDPGMQSYVHFNAPNGHLTYTVRPFNDPYYGGVASVPLTVGTPGYINNFDSNNGQWVATPATGGWEWGIPWGISGLTPHSLPNVWGTVVAGNYTDNACWQLDLNLGLVVTSEAATVEFYHWFYSQASYDGCNFKVSVDNGATWTVLTPTSGGYSTTALLVTTCMTGQPAWAGTTPWAWQRCVIPIGQFVGQVPIFRFEFSSNATTSTYPGFYFDDFEIWGVSGQQSGIPTACTNLVGSYVEPNVVLTWTDPTLDSQGNPLSIDSVQVWLGTAGSGTRLGSVGPGVQTFTHLNAPIGIRTYSVRPCHGSFFGPPVSVTVTVGNPGYVNDFNTNDGGWTTPAAGGWSWGAPTNTSAPVPHSTPNYWGTGLMAGYPADACWQLNLDQGLVVTGETATIEFWYWFYTEQTYDGCNLKASVDNGVTWTILTPSQGAYTVTSASTANTCMAGQPMWSGLTTPVWQYAVVPIGQFLGQVPIFRFEFGADPIVSGYAGFFFDDVIIWGASQQAGIPRPCTNLTGNYTEPNVTLTWTDPTLDTHGSPLVVDSVQIWLGAAGTGTLLGTVGPGVQTFTHLNAPIGILTYTIRPRNDAFWGAPTSVQVTVGSPSYVNNFELDNGNWVPDPSTGGWEWGTPTLPASLVPHSGTKVWGTVLNDNYPNGACCTLTLSPNLTVQSPTATVEFWRWLQTEQSYDGVNFKVSTDEGATWTLVQPVGNYPYTASTANVCIPSEPYWAGTGTTWAYIVIPVGQFIGQTLQFRFTFGSDASVVYPGFFFDDMIVWGLQLPVGFPRACTNLAGNYAAPNVVLTWTDPNQDMTGLPLTPDSIQIWLGTIASGQRIGVVAAGVQTFTQVNAPTGQATYTVRAFAGGHPSSPTSVPVVVGNPTYVNDFELNDGLWVPDPPTGGWEWGVPTYTSGPTAHSGTKVWGTVLASTYGLSVCYKLTLSPGLVVRSPSASVEFWRWYNTESSYDGCNFFVSVDNGGTWQLVQPSEGGYTGTTNAVNTCNPSLPAWTGNTGTTWTHVNIPIGQYVDQVPQFRFTFGSDGSVVYPGFYFDDMLIWGLQPPSSITGTVRAFLSNRPIAGARVWATDWPDTAVTDSVGFYELGIDAGTYSVTVDHVHFCDTTFAGVVVVEGGQTDRDAVLRWPVAQITRTSITFLTFPGVDVSDTFRISNNGGQCPLDFAIADTSAWLTTNPASGTVNPNESVIVTVNAEAPEIVGDYSSSLTLTYNAVGTPSVIRVDLSTVDAAGERGVIPTVFAYYQNYPNPFNAQTSLHFDVPQQSRVQITIYNIMGQQVARPVDRPYAPGRYRVAYDASGLPSGMYLVKMTAADYTKIGKMMLLK